jgi:hypothetical protein
MLQKLWYPDIYIGEQPFLEASKSYWSVTFRPISFFLFTDKVKTISQPILVSKPASLRIYRDGRIRYSTRLTITTSCKNIYFLLQYQLPKRGWCLILWFNNLKTISEISGHFDFHYYPADTQRCSLDIKSCKRLEKWDPRLCIELILFWFLDAYTDRNLVLMWRSATFAHEIQASNFYVGMDKTGTFIVKTGSGLCLVLH